jgi:hypothetical protein
MAYVYKHIRPDTNQVFYVGIATNPNRIYSSRSRNKYWHNIVEKYGKIEEIIEDNLTWEVACEREKYWINFYGRKSSNGLLCNMTDGGEGTIGKIVDQKTKDKISISKKGKKLSKEHINKISEGNKGKPKPKPDNFGEKMREIVKGTIRTDESKKKQSITTKLTLSKIKDKLSEKSQGTKNSNSVKYILYDKVNEKKIEIVGYKSVLNYYNQLTGNNKKDAMFLINKIKNDSVIELKFIESVKYNSK